MLGVPSGLVTPLQQTFGTARPIYSDYSEAMNAKCSLPCFDPPSSSFESFQKFKNVQNMYLVEDMQIIIKGTIASERMPIPLEDEDGVIHVHYN